MGESLITRKNKIKLKQYFVLFMVFLVFVSGMLPSFASMSIHAEGINLEEPNVSIDVDGESKKEIVKGEDFNYNVKVILPEDVSGYEAMTILDDLDKRLIVEATQVLVGGEGDATLEVVVEGQKVSLTLTQEQLAGLAGKEVALQITAKIREDVASEEEIENIADIVIGDNPAIETNLVTVTTTANLEEEDTPADLEEEQPTEPDVSKGEDKSEKTKFVGESPDASLTQVETSAAFEINHTDSYGISWEAPGVIYQFDGNNPSNTPKSSITVRGVVADKLLNGLALSKQNNHFYIASGTELFRINPSGESLKVTDLLGETGNGAMSIDGTEYYYSYGQDGKVFFASFDLPSGEHNSIEVIGLDSGINSLGGDLLVDADGLIWFTQGNRLIQFDPTDGNVILNTELPSDDPNVSGRGLSFLPDGRVLLAGGAGNESNPMLYIYDPELHEINYLGTMPGAFIVDLASVITPSFNPPAPGELKVIKEDEEDGTKLAGATFELTNADNGSVAELTTNENGEKVLTDLEAGSYALVETVAPEGYELRDEAIDVTIDNDKPTVVTIKNTKMIEPIDPPDACVAPVALINGSFEEPQWSPDDSRLYGHIGWFDVQQEHVPGWQTTDSTGILEIMNIELGNAIPPGSPYEPLRVTPADGNQYAELNSREFAQLYQDVDTTPGQTIYWRLAHHGRLGPDTMALKIDSADVAPAELTTIEEMTSDNAGWTHYSGSYVVPAGQTKTRFGFEAIESYNGSVAAGNFLDDIFLGTEPCVDAEKSVSPDGEVYAGEELTYEVTVKNSGGDVAADMIIEDEIPEGTEYVPGSMEILNGPKEGDLTDADDEDAGHYADGKVTFNIGDLPNTTIMPEGVTVQFKVITLNEHAGKVVVNEANVTHKNLLTDEDHETPTNETETPVKYKDPVLESVKSAQLETKADGNTDADNPEVGDTIRYTIQTKNTIEDSLIENLVITDNIPEGLTYVAGSLEIDGESVTDASDDDAGHVVDGEVTGNFGDITDTADHAVTFLVTVDEGQAGKDIKNIAIVNSGNHEPDDPEEETRIYPRVPVLESEKLAENLEAGKDTFEVGDTVVYSIQTRNTVTDSLVENLVITDELPEGLAFVEGSLSVSHDGEATFTDGVVTATFGDVEDTEWRTVTFEATIESGQSGETIENVATVEGDDVPPTNPGTEIIVDPKDPELESNKSSTLETKADGNTDADNPEVGDTIRYTITTQNTIEDSLIENLVITDSIPEGLTYAPGSLKVDDESVTDVEDDDVGHVIDGKVTGNFGDIMDTEDHTVTFLVTVDEGQAGKDIKNIAVVDSDNHDPDEPEEEVKIYPRDPVLESEKSAQNLDADKDKFEVGDTIVYTIKTRNTVSDGIVEGLTITDELPEGLEYVAGSLEVDGESVTDAEDTDNGHFSDGKAVGHFGDITDTEWHTLTFHAEVMPGQSDKTIKNIAVVGGDNIDDPDEPEEEIVVDPKDPKLESEKSAQLEEKLSGNTDVDNPEVGDTLLYTIQTRNTVEDSLVTNLVISDEIPEGLDYVTDSLKIDGESVTDAEGDDRGHYLDGSVAGQFGNIMDTDWHTLEFLVTVQEGEAGSDIINVAVVDGDNIDEPDEPEEEVKIYPRDPVLESEKSAQNLDADKDKFEVGDTIVYTIKARNTVSDSLVENLTITDKLPAGLEYIEDSLEVSHEGTGKFTDGTITANFGDVKDTEWRTITFQAKINSDQSGETIKNVATVDADNVTEPHHPEAKVVVEKKDSVTPAPEKTEPPADVEKEEGQQLPKTATNMFNFVLLGIIAMLVGLATLRIRKTKER